MARFEDLSGEILMAIFEYMRVEDVWTIFFNMNYRLNSLVFDSRLRLTADVSNIDRTCFDQFCSSLINTNFSNIFTLILSNNYYRYPQIQSFLSQTSLNHFQSLHALTLIDINYNELAEISKQIKDLPLLNYLHVNTHEIFREKDLVKVTHDLLDQSKIRVCLLVFHEVCSTKNIETSESSRKMANFLGQNIPKPQSFSINKIKWPQNKKICSCYSEVLSIDYINADCFDTLLENCPNLHSLDVTVDPRPTLPATISNGEQSIPSPLITTSFPQLINLRLCFRPFNASVLEHLLQSVPNLRRCSIETIICSTEYLRAPFWTLLLQKCLPQLERIRLVLRAWLVLKADQLQFEHKIDATELADGYRYDRYWLDRTQNRFFVSSSDLNHFLLRIR